MPDYRETIIRIDHDSGLAEVWTPYQAVQRLMLRCGAKPLERQIAGEWWQVEVQIGTRGIRFGKQRILATPGARRAALANLVKARAAREQP